MCVVSENKQMFHWFLQLLVVMLTNYTPNNLQIQFKLYETI